MFLFKNVIIIVARQDILPIQLQKKLSSLIIYYTINFLPGKPKRDSKKISIITLQYRVMHKPVQAINKNY